MKRILGILIIVVFLFGVCLMEELLVTNSLNKIKEDSNYLYNLASATEDVNTTEIITLTFNMQEYWIKREHLLCYFINYKDMGEMSNEIVRMTSYCQSNIKEEYVASLQLLIYYCETFNHITGLNLQNIF